MKALVTGAAGFVGTNLVIRLLKNGHTVIGADSLVRRGSEKNREFLRQRYSDFKFYEAEIEDMPSFIMIEKPDVVYHLAAQVAVTSSLINPERDFAINATGTLKISKAASDIGAPVVYTSTNKVFGDNVNKVPIKELQTRYDFSGKLEGRGISETFSVDASHHTPYGLSKLAGDFIVREFGGVANRCSCMYGRYQHGIVDQGWMSFFAINKLNNHSQDIYGDGKQVRDAVHAEDVVKLLEMEGLRLLDKTKPSIAGGVFNVGGGYENTISLKELCDVWNVKKINYHDWRPADQKVFYCDIRKAKKVLGWVPQVKLKDGLADLMTWTREEYT